MSTSYRDILEDVSNPGGFTGLIHFYALSTVLNQPIESYYPPCSHHFTGIQCFNRVVYGRDVRHSVAAMYIMWSKVNFNTDEPFTPNHFVPLFKHTENISITISEEEENSNVTNPINDQSLELIVNIPRNVSNVTNDPEYQDILFHKENHQTLLSDTDDILLSQGKNLVSVHSSGTPLFSTKFLDITEIVGILKSPTFVHTSIPDGLKNNVYFILDEKKNMKRKSYVNLQNFMTIVVRGIVKVKEHQLHIIM